MGIISIFYNVCVHASNLRKNKTKTDLVAPWQSVHLHQLALGVKNQLCEGEQLRGEGAFG